MIIFAHKLANVPIISLSSGGQVGHTTKPLIDWKDLKIVAFHAKGLDQKANLLLLTQDLREYNVQLILVNSEDDLVAPEEVIRMQPLLEKNFELIGAQVKTESGVMLGHLADYAFDPKSFLIEQIHVKRSLLKSFLSDRLIINRDQIVDVNPPVIVVRDATIQEPIVATQPAVSE